MRRVPILKDCVVRGRMLAVCEAGVPSWMAEAARGEHTIPRNITQERAGEMARDLSDMEGRVCL